MTPSLPVPKPTFKRYKPSAAKRGAISTKVRQRVHKRSGGCCEWCGWSPGAYDATGRKMGLQVSHLVRRWKLTETTENDCADLCGPSVNNGTCHWKVDFTSEGREWAALYHETLNSSK